MNRILISLLAILLLLPGRLQAQKFQVETNAVGLMCLGTLNAELSYGFARHWSVGLTARYNPFTFQRHADENQQMQLKQRSVAANARWWPWHIYSGWWLSGMMQWQEYSSGGILSQETEEGRKLGGGLSAGYSLMVSRHLNVDFGLGVWGGMKQFTVYACPKCGTKLSEGAKAFVLPSDVVIALSYVF